MKFMQAAFENRERLRWAERDAAFNARMDEISAEIAAIPEGPGKTFDQLRAAYDQEAIQKIRQSLLEGEKPVRRRPPPQLRRMRSPAGKRRRKAVR